MKQVKQKLILLLAMMLITAYIPSFADYVDNSNQEHADQTNDIIQKSFISKGNTVVIYLKNDAGIDESLGQNLDTYDIPFVKIYSADIEKVRLDDKGKNEMISSYYNKITLKVSHAIHDKARFIVINNFVDGEGNEKQSDPLMHSIRKSASINKLTSSEKDAANNTESGETAIETEPSEKDQEKEIEVLSASFLNAALIEIQFDQPLDSNAASQIENYSISKGQITDVGVLDNGKKILLTFAYNHEKVEGFEILINNVPLNGESESNEIRCLLANTELVHASQSE